MGYIMLASVYIQFSAIHYLVFLIVFMKTLPENHASVTKTTINLVPSISVPVALPFAPEQRFLMDWCLQMSFEVPTHSITNTIIWPEEREDSTRHLPQRRHIDFSKYQAQATSPSVDVQSLRSQMHPYDWTAGELYLAIEELLMSYGFHWTCLQLMVCELARHSFTVKQHDEQASGSANNVLAEMITFLLSPSMHEAFDQRNEQKYKYLYETAELNGLMSHDCQQIYFKCTENPLESFTGIFF